MRKYPGLRTLHRRFVTRNSLERPAKRGESPVRESDRQQAGSRVPETRETLWEVRTTPKAKYYLVTDSA